MSEIKVGQIWRVDTHRAHKLEFGDLVKITLVNRPDPIGIVCVRGSNVGFKDGYWRKAFGTVFIHDEVEVVKEILKQYECSD